MEGPAAESLRMKLPCCTAAHDPACFEAWRMLVEKGAGERQGSLVFLGPCHSPAYNDIVRWLAVPDT